MTTVLARDRHLPTIDTAGTRPLSYNQEAFILLEELSPRGRGDLAAQNALRYAELRGPLDVVALRHAIDVVTARHESLRTHFARHGEDWIQVVESDTHAPLHLEDLRRVGARTSDPIAAMRERAHERHHETRDLGRTPLWDVAVFTLDDDLHVLQLRMHHLIGDMQSGIVVHRELDLEYQRALGADVAPLDPAVQYEAHRRRQRERLDRFLEGGRNVDEWRDIVAYRKGMLFGLRQMERIVPMRFTTGAERTGAMEAIELIVPEPILRAIRRAARGFGVTEGTMCLAAWNRALATWCGQDRLVVWSEKSVRAPQFPGVVGTFADPTVFVTDVDEASPIAQTVEQVDRQQREYLRTDGMLVAGLHADPALLEGLAPLLGTYERAFFQFLGIPAPWPTDTVLGPTDLIEPFDFQDGPIDLHACLISARDHLRLRLRHDSGTLDRPAMDELGVEFLRELAAMAREEPR